MVSVIIPAHNEAAVIAESLRALTDGAAPGELDVIVVANGCSDDTAAIARALGPPVRVVETDVPSKANALNLGDAAATVFPRVYMDADVAMTVSSLRALTRALAEGALAAAPRPVLDLSASSWGVRAYYGIDMRLPWFGEGIGNAGVYALSRDGRARFARFPAVTTDDGFVRLQFRPDERRTVADATAVVTAPATLAGLIAIKARSDFGRREIARYFPQLLRNAGPANKPVLLRMCRDPRNWPALAVYLYVKLAARLRSRRKYRLDGGNRWERDDSRPRVSSATTPTPVATPQQV